MVKPHTVRTELSHHAQIISALRSPLLFVPDLQHILGRPAVASTTEGRARQSAIGNTSHGLQWWHDARSTGSHNDACGGGSAAAAAAAAAETYRLIGGCHGLVNRRARAKINVMIEIQSIG